jgi:Holliday junction resolvasome RuvABC endonuclease subunit
MANEPVAMGIDPSLSCTGIACVGPLRTDWYVTTVIAGSPSDPLSERLAILQAAVRTQLDISTGGPQGRPVVAVVERGFSGGKGPTAWLNGTAAGAVITALTDLVPVLLVPPKVRAKLATGKGNADKLSVLIAARDRLAYQGQSFDEADALWLAMTGFILAGGSHKVPKNHVEVLDQYEGVAHWT